MTPSTTTSNNQQQQQDPYASLSIQELTQKRDQLKEANQRLRKVVQIAREGLTQLSQNNIHFQQSTQSLQNNASGADTNTHGTENATTTENSTSTTAHSEPPSKRVQDKKQFYNQLRELNSTVQQQCNQHRERFNDLLRKARERAQKAALAAGN